ncbi:MerR family DNA-binding transcriptional regulator [Paenibacillus sp. 23TSA30-6]
MEGMTRGELSQRTGLSMATIRYYENNGVLPAPKRLRMDTVYIRMTIW